jgi:hypothetical protein
MSAELMPAREEETIMSRYGGEFDYVGLHAFVFIDHIDPDLRATEVVDRLFHLRSDNGRVLWASTFVGDYLAFAHVQVGDKDDDKNLGRLQDFIDDDLWSAGVHCKWATEITKPGKVGIKRDTPEIIALVGIETEQGRAEEVRDRLQGEFPKGEPGVAGFKGASVVLGHLDVVLQVRGDTFDDVVQNILGIQGFDGILSTSTAIADGTRGPFAEKKRSKKSSKKGAKKAS